MPRDPQELLTALHDHLLEGDRITAVRPLSTGHSNETYLLEGLDLILRLPPGGPPLIPFGHGMRTQYELYAIVRGLAGAPPVPAVRYFCADESVLGLPFFLMERIVGEPFDDYGTTTWMNEGTPQLRETVTRNLIAAIAQYNALPVLDVLGPVLDNVAELRRWRSMADEAGDAPLVAVFDDLEAAPAPATGPPGLVHGDAKFSNMLWNDGTVAGVLDIEMSFNGDPAWDLGYVLAYFPSPVRDPMPGCGLPGMIDRETVLELWERGTGRSARDIAWYEAASMAKIAAILTYGGYLARTGKSSDERMLGWPEWSAAKLLETKALITLIGKPEGIA